MSGAFKKIANATPTGGGNHIRDGVYKFLIERLNYIEGHTGDTCIAELRVIESAPNGDVDEKGVATVPNAVGSSCSFVCSLDLFENAAGNFKAFLIGATAGIGGTEAEITEDKILEMCGPNNPLRGLAVIDETYRGYNKGKKVAANRGKHLTLNKWSGIPQTLEDLHAQRAWLDANVARADIAPKAPAAAPAASAPSAPVTSAPTASAPPAVAPAGGGILANLAALGRK